MVGVVHLLLLSLLLLLLLMLLLLLPGVVVIGMVRIDFGSLVRWCIDHGLEALLRRRQLREVVFGMGTADMLLHGTIPLLLLSQPRSASHMTRAEVWFL